MSLPDGYEVRNGCHDCGNVFKWEEYDEDTTWYCAFGAPPRPLCWSVKMEEYDERVYDFIFDSRIEWMA